MRKARLSTTSVECLVDAAVLPAFEWSTPRWLDVCLIDPFDRDSPITADNPPRMLFHVHSANTLALPTELGALHLAGLDSDLQVLAPWAIDDATDRLFATQTPAEEVLALITDSLRGVFWGLHDWAHFHSHGPFERVAETELQCDLAALAWMWDNREVLTLDAQTMLALATRVAELWRARFRAEERALDATKAWSYLAQRTGLEALRM